MPFFEPAASRLSRLKDLVELCQSGATVVALVLAGVWFFAQREALPRATVSHSISHRDLTPDATWVHASIRITNIGKRKLRLEKATVWLQRILPVDKALGAKLERREPMIPSGQTTVAWPRIGQVYDVAPGLHLEPGEDDEVECEFIVSSLVKTVKLYSHFVNTPEVGWQTTSLYDIDRENKRAHNDMGNR